ncbi:MAG: hypothetical protein G01um1014106_271 [Parcubacteria group bacterium Gr01-1014_106]|nr:MAG: hypothetical protein G01um1014106_271 [Parcubacteria group bacterium Gr01-1014_106]
MEPIDLRKVAAGVSLPGATSVPAAKSGWWERITGEPMKRREKVIGGVALILFLFVFYITLDANKYRATVRVIEGRGRIGVNPTTESLDFGDLSPGTSAVREVRIENRTAIPMFIAVIRMGAITDLMKLEQNFYVLPGKSDTTLTFRTYMPASAPVDRIFNGRVYLFKIPGPWPS